MRQWIPNNARGQHAFSLLARNPAENPKPTDMIISSHATNQVRWRQWVGKARLIPDVRRRGAMGITSMSGSSLDTEA